MEHDLSFTRLLALLKVEQETSAVRSLTEETLKAINNNDWETAIRLASKAVEVAHDAHRPNREEGKALLYLSLAYLSKGVPSDLTKAIAYCERAITILSLNDHNYVLAEIFRAQIDRQEEDWTGALDHLGKASERLTDLMLNSQRSGNLKQLQAYQDLHDRILALTEQVNELLSKWIIMDGSIPKSYTKQDIRFVGDMEPNSDVHREEGSAQVNIMLTSASDEISGASLPKLTPVYLITEIGPYLNAIADIQSIMDELQKREPRETIIKSITQVTPITVSLEGAAEAIETIENTVIPSRREQAERLRRILEEQKRAEVLESRARAEKDRRQAEKLVAEAALIKLQSERQLIENKKLQLEMIELALNLLTHLRPDLAEPERLSYAMRLLSPLKVIIESGVQIS